MENLANKQNGTSSETVLEVKKSKKADLEGFKPTWILMGYIFILAAILVAFEYTQRELKINTDIVATEITLEETIEIPITIPEKKVVPPPPQAVTAAEVLNIVEDDADIEESTIASTEDQGEVVEIKEDAVVVVEEEPEEETIFQAAENMPEFPGGTTALFKYLKDNIKYPSICLENGIQGKALMLFVVGKDGSISDVNVFKSTGDPYLDKEAVRVVKSMPHWKPGSQRGKPVNVRFNLPITFKIPK